MKISPGDKALLITIIITSSLVLFFFFVGVKPYPNPISEEYFEIPLSVEDTEEEEQEVQNSRRRSNTRIRSHRAYNLRELRKEQEQFEEEDPVRKAIENNELQSAEELASKTEAFLEEQQASREVALLEKKEEVVKAIATREKSRLSQKGNAPSTVRYDLGGRRTISIPNPVYTCDAVGDIVLNIEVNNKGLITQMDFNKKASTSSNGCLIDQALLYARQARFEEKNLEIQKGTITFLFQS